MGAGQIELATFAGSLNPADIGTTSPMQSFEDADAHAGHVQYNHKGTGRNNGFQQLLQQEAACPSTLKRLGPWPVERMREL